MIEAERPFFHEPVLLAETIAALRVAPEGSYIDCTVGGGGHAEAILERLGPTGRLLGIDADPEAIAYAAERLRNFGDALVLVQANFRDIAPVARQHGFGRVHGILFDLGVSAHQLLTPYRGFSLQFDAPLDMRFSPEQELTAADLVNTLSEQDLADLIYRLGEEPRSRRIARAIVAHRPVATTGQLAGIVAQATGGARGKTHPATRTFQALRMAVNQELEALGSGLTQAVDLLLPAGRLVVISFHSLEDRVVKEFMRAEAAGCTCPPKVPVCTCGHQARLKPLYRSVVKPSATEVEHNPRSRSAKLRAAERL